MKVVVQRVTRASVAGESNSIIILSSICVILYRSWRQGGERHWQGNLCPPWNHTRRQQQGSRVDVSLTGLMKKLVNEEVCAN